MPTAEPRTLDDPTGDPAHGVRLRAAQPADVDTLHRFVEELARDEEFPGAVTATAESLRRALFDDEPIARAVVAERQGAPIGFALYYFAYSTIVGTPTLHLEDLYVTATQRGGGVGLQLLRHLARLAVEVGCGRFEWWVLKTNVDAIRFYQRLGARKLREIDVMRLDGQALSLLVDG